MKNAFIFNKIAFILFTLIILTWGCKKDESSTKEKIDVNYISGVIQKGPFLNGTSVTLYELDNSAHQSGTSFNTQTTDNYGSFQFDNITLATNHALLKADGYYYDEVNDQNSLSPLTLYALCEVGSTSNVNINILTHLEKDRIFYLMNNGASYVDAKAQVKGEIYSIFRFNYPSQSNAENLSITGSGQEDAILLATSLIFQGATRSVSDFSQLMADFIADFKTDGVINSASVGTALINDAKFLNLSQIRQHLENKYSSSTIPNFEQYIHQFIDSTNFVFTRFIQYPDFGTLYPNLLSDTISVYPKSGSFPNYFNSVELYAILPEHTSLRVTFDNGFLIGSNMQIEFPNSSGGWQLDGYWGPPTSLKTTQIGTVEYFEGIWLTGDSATISIYENGDTIPTRIKHIIGQ